MENTQWVLGVVTIGNVHSRDLSSMLRAIRAESNPLTGRQQSSHCDLSH